LLPIPSLELVRIKKIMQMVYTFTKINNSFLTKSYQYVTIILVNKKKKKTLVQTFLFP
jgi:hypothetical protein